MTRFEIKKLDNQTLLVILLTFELFEEYWDELCKAIASYNIPDADVYFDYLVKNGTHERFFITKLNGLDLMPNHFNLVTEMDPLIISLCNSYFQENPEALKTSALSQKQQKIFINGNHS